MSLGSILGGIAGLLIPGGGAITAALGSGLGGLFIDKKKPKDAIKDALIAGVGAKFFGPALQSSGFGSGITGALSSAGIGGQMTASQLAATGGAAPLQQAVAGEVAKQTATNLAVQGSTKAAEKGFMSSVLGGNPLMLYGGLTALGAVEELTKPKGGFGEELFLSKHTGNRFKTAEERDEYDSRWRAAQNRKRGYEHYTDPYGGDQEAPIEMAGIMQGVSNMASQPMFLAQGGYIEGPGTGRSDSIPAQIYQDGQPVQKAALSDGEFVMTERAVKGAGNGNREKGAAKMYAMMREFERS